MKYNNTLLFTPTFKPLAELNEIDFSLTNIFILSVEQNFKAIEQKYQQILPATEIAKAKRYQNLTNQHQFVLGRYFLRSLLAKFSGLPPNQIEIHFDTNKKPYTSGILFNISHAANRLLIAISPKTIGIDVEFLNAATDYASILPDSFTKAEQDFILQSNPRLDYFFTLWTRKEALLKATGEGLTDNLNQINCLAGNISRQNQNLKLFSFKLDNQYISSLASADDAGNFAFWQAK